MPRTTRRLLRPGPIVATALAGLCAAAVYFSAPQLYALTHDADVTSKLLRKQATVAQNLVLRFEGNPSTGFTWRLNRKRSRGLNLVTVKQLGWSFPAARGSSGQGRSGILRYLVVGKRAGTARLVFDYGRHLEGVASSAQWTYEVSITR